jgi:hypothetical protein
VGFSFHGDPRELNVHANFQFLSTSSMAEAGPSSPATSISRHSRSPNVGITLETSSKSIGLGAPPIFRNTPQSQHHGSSRINRRRIKSESLPIDVAQDLGRAELQPAVPRMSTKSEKRPVPTVDNVDIGMGAFSDEYDLGEYYCSVVVIILSEVFETSSRR